MNDNIMYYVLKRGDPSSFDHAVPLNKIASAPQRLLCSGKTIKRIEIIFPIRLTTPVPTANVLNEHKRPETPIVFTSDQTNPSRTIFFSETNIRLDGKYLEFMVSRDCAISFEMED